MSTTSESAGRYELKFALDPLAFERARVELLLHPSALRRQFPTRRVQSLYFDRAGEPALRDSLEGHTERSKLRLRWYGDQVLGVHARLELKSRSAQLGFKRSTELSEPVDIDGASRASFTDRVRALVPADWRVRLVHDERPVQWLAYEREYWRSASGRVRVTIDRALTTYDQRCTTRITRRAMAPLSGLTIVELKAAAAALDELRELSSALSVAAEKCSKLLLASRPLSLGRLSELN